MIGLLQLIVPETRTVESENPFLDKAVEGASRLHDGTETGNGEMIREGISRLIGLGPGLTPSGDDVVTGFVLALLEGERLGLLSQNRSSTLVHAIRSLSPGKTNTSSHSMLELACRGLAGETLNQLIVSLYGRGAQRVEEDAERLIRIGHSSGTDMVLGVLLATDLLS
jgi:hypothetical protein